VISNERLNGYELGFGSGLSPNGLAPVISGRTRLHGLDSALLRGARPQTTGPRCWPTEPIRGFGPKAKFKEENIFLF
jgi:hypothetical protein